MSTSYESADQLQSRPPARRPLGLRETLALIFITVGSIVLSVFGWIVGIILLGTSAVWTTREKLVGTFVLPGGLFPAYLLWTGGVGTYGCGSTSWSGPDGVVHHSVESCTGPILPVWVLLLIAAIVLLAPVVTAIWLGMVAYRRANATA